MTISATDVRFDDDTMWVSLSDGRTLGVPLAWFPRLMEASVEHRSAVTFTAYGMHWEALDEDISVPALIEGRQGQAA